MSSVNKVIALGNLGKDPDVRYLSDGKCLANFSIACTETYKDKNNEKQEKTEWIRVTLFGKVAEIAAEYLHKGSKCYIEGRLQTRKWHDKEGQDRYTTEVVGDKLVLLGGKNDNDAKPQSNAGRANQGAQKSGDATDEGFENFEDDLPF